MVLCAYHLSFICVILYYYNICVEFNFYCECNKSFMLSKFYSVCSLSFPASFSSWFFVSKRLPFFRIAAFRKPPLAYQTYWSEYPFLRARSFCSNIFGRRSHLSHIKNVCIHFQYSLNKRIVPYHIVQQHCANAKFWPLKSHCRTL